MDKVKTGELIRDARKKKNYTQSELGDMLGVSNKAVSRWEKGDIPTGNRILLIDDNLTYHSRLRQLCPKI